MSKDVEVVENEMGVKKRVGEGKIGEKKGLGVVGTRLGFC
jgi:hypothetical protein